MPFLDTLPADIDRAGPGSPWARFLVDDARRVLHSVQTLCRGDVPVTVGLAHGPYFVASLWSVDEVQKVLHFSIDRAAVVDPHLLRANRLWGVAYEDGAKLQFHLRQFVFEDGPQQRLMHAALPPSLYRLPRREDVRVRPAEPGAPTVRFRHPLAPQRWTQLRAMNIGLHGCALWWPLEAMPLPQDMALPQAEVELDVGTRFRADLWVQHVTPGRPDSWGDATNGASNGASSSASNGASNSASSRAADVQAGLHGGTQSGMQVGCRWDGLEPPARQALAAWLRSGQSRRDRVSLSFENSET